MRSAVNWFIDNPIAANILMLTLIIGGCWLGYGSIKKEAFPTGNVDFINVSMAYPGAAPSEVEQQIVIRIEEAIADLSGIFKITSQSRQGSGSVSIEVIDGVDPKEVLNDVKARVDAIFTFPASAERPIIRQNLQRNTLIWFALWGDAEMIEMKQLAYQIRDDLSLMAGVSEVHIHGLRQDEISIEISENDLRRYQLTFSEIATAIRANSMNVPAGAIKTRQGNIQIQTRAQAYIGEDFEKIVVRSNIDGTQLLLSDVATVHDGFSEQEIDFSINDKPGLNFEVKMSDDPDLFGGTTDVRAYIDDLKKRLPDNLDVKINFEAKFLFDGRFNLLKDNAVSGLILVFVILMLFLRPLLALWVVVGIGTAFSGAFLILPLFGVSLNMLSMFAFLMVLGIVVDDAIIIGESIYDKQHEGLEGKESSRVGTLRVLKPVTLSVLSTIIFFLPMIDVPKQVQPYTISIFFVVCFCLLFSLVESLWILPSHLSHMKKEKPSNIRVFQILEKVRSYFASGMENFARNIYQPALRKALARPGVVITGFVFSFFICLSLVVTGWVSTRFFPNPPQPFIMINVSYPEGSPYQYSLDLAEYLEEQAQALNKEQDLLDENNGNTFISEVNTTTTGNSLTLFIGLTPAELRPLAVDPISERLRELIGPLPEVQSFSLNASQGGGGSDIQLNMKLASNLVSDQNRAVADVQKVLGAYPGIENVRSNLDTGRLEIELELKPYAETMGVTMASIANQVRQSFYGEEVQRIPRSKEDVKVMLRYPREERSTLNTLDDIRIRTPSGSEVPLETVANIELVPGTSTIRRTDRSRNITITADVEEGQDPSAIVQQVLADYLPQWKKSHPGFDLSTDGNLRAQAQFGANFSTNFLLAFIVALALFAISFKSLVEPFLVMLAVPFGFMGAVLGHLIFQQEISLMSFFGFLACSGVVVNDNLVLLERLNALRDRGLSAFDAALQAGVDRFRPIVLTSLTTFVGLLPILSDQSTQAQFLIPMVIALAFGVLVSSVVTLFMVPCTYFAGYSIGQSLKSVWKQLGKLAANGGSPRVDRQTQSIKDEY